MDGIAGVSLKKIIELVLAIVALILILSKGISAVGYLFFIFLCIGLAYLCLIVIMACLSRDIGASPAIEGATGLQLTAYSLDALINKSPDGMLLGTYICTAALGIMLLVFLLF